MTARGGLAALMTCVAAAVAAAPAAAVEYVPAGVPLDGLETVLPLNSPTVRSGVPLPVVGAPEGPRHVTGQLLPDRLLPRVPVTGELAPTLIKAPLPDLPGQDARREASLATPVSEVAASSPGASLAAPVTEPRGNALGLPDLAVPGAALLTPELRGAPVAGLGLL
ncbi:hypothetical protein QMK19_38780 [Streptomyces sp. H10-C2]|uniref:hypothetical protein n=1 Tax=unclassified Streptomyces TaxID=2593676 RepID=UPI0024B99BB5|nr:MULTISPECIES: hypothetical protein [unclassified Streptomyces]MDJ0347136.1 hypothetical protein [Streptomyces sp. PH10-H1]MDJ0375382.1 hypothetical protein [Streptomyces sp. H10-C2]